MKPRMRARLPTSSAEVARAGRRLGRVVLRDRAAERDPAAAVRARRWRPRAAGRRRCRSRRRCRRAPPRAAPRGRRRGARTRRRSRARRARRRPSPARRRCRSRGSRAPSRSGPRRCRPRPPRRRRTRSRPPRTGAISVTPDPGGHARHPERAEQRARRHAVGHVDAGRTRSASTSACSRQPSWCTTSDPARRRPRPRRPRRRTSPCRARRAARRTCASLMRPRMYGSTLMKRLRTSSLPSPGSPSSRSASSKSSGDGLAVRAAARVGSPGSSCGRTVGSAPWSWRAGTSSSRARASGIGRALRAALRRRGRARRRRRRPGRRRARRRSPRRSAGSRSPPTSAARRTSAR